MREELPVDYRPDDPANDTRSPDDIRAQELWMRNTYNLLRFAQHAHLTGQRQTLPRVSVHNYQRFCDLRRTQEQLRHYAAWGRRHPSHNEPPPEAA